MWSGLEGRHPGRCRDRKGNKVGRSRLLLQYPTPRDSQSDQSDWPSHVELYLELGIPGLGCTPISWAARVPWGLGTAHCQNYLSPHRKCLCEGT